MKTTCSVSGCDSPVRCKGLCGLHYDRVRRTGGTDLQERVAKACRVDGCTNPHNARGYCRAHYRRLLASGDARPDIPLVYKPPVHIRDDVVTRILAQTVRSGDCIEWTGYRLPSGYGTIGWRGRTWVVHRAMWTATVGPVPTDDDWTLDHLCRNRRCVNIDHLEVVTRTENSRRGGGLLAAREVNRNTETCRKGLHPWVPENWFYNADGSRTCLECKRIRTREGSQRLRDRRKAALAASS